MTTIILTTGSNWPVPVNCPVGTVVQVENWGAGSGGSGTTTHGAGGGGGAYALQNYVVTPNDVANGVSFVLGAGSAGTGAANPVVGGNTTWSSSKNIVPNTVMNGAVIGTPGTLPTGWSSNLQSGIAVNVIGFGTDHTTGYQYIDLQFVGTAAAAGSNQIFYAADNTPVLASTTYIQSAYFAIVGGTVTNLLVSNVAQLAFDTFNSGGTYVSGVYGGIIATFNSTLTQTTNSGATTAGVAFADQYFQVNTAAAGAVNVTVRFAAAQLETNASATFWQSTPGYTQAAGGSFPATTTGGVGGTTANSIGTTLFAGGNGANFSALGSGGGGAAGPSGAGNNATTGGGSGDAGSGGAGGAVTVTSPANPGNANSNGGGGGGGLITATSGVGGAGALPGGGGGGAATTGSTGGVGGAGQIRLTYTPQGAGAATGTGTASAIGQSVDTTTGTATGTGTTVATGTPFIFNFMSGSLPSGITFARASAATYFDHTGTMQTASSGVPRFDYNPTTLVLNGILVEEGRTNLLLNSASLSTQSVTTSATTYALSFYGTGTVTLSGTYSGSLTGSGAYPTRSSLVFTATAGTLTCTVTGTVTDGQLEGGNFPTSYIPTTSAAVTRQPDTMTFSSSILTTPFSIVVGAMYQTLGIAGSGQHLFYLQDASSSDGIRTYKAGNTTNVATAGVGTVSGSVASFTTILGTPFLYGMSYSGTTLLATMNGATPASATLTGSFTPATLNVGNDAGSGFTDGWLQTLTYWPTALTGAQLQSLTSSQTVGTATGTDTAPAIGQSTAATTGSSTNVTSFSRATTATYVNTSGNIATAAINVERTQYGSPYIESAAATNLQTQSQFASGTGNTNATVTLNSTTAPDTTTTAMLVTATAASTTIHLASQSESTPTASTNYCLSVFAFPGTEINVGVHIRVGGNWLNGVCDGSFVLSGAGTATLTAGGSQAGVGIANVGNGWYRCWVHGQSAATGLAGQTNWYSVQNSAGSDNYTATGNETCYFWGSQWELGTTPSSYIPTTTVAVTRAADILYDVAFSQSTALTTGTATGTGTASGESVVGTTTGTATGSSTATAIGQSTAATAGTATGASTAPAIGQSTFATHGQATGAGTAPAIGQSAAATIATATGSSTAAAFSQQSGNLTTGTAAGTSAVSAIAQSTVASTGEAIGAGTGAAFAANIPVAIVIRGGAADAETERQKYFDWKTRHPRRKKVSPPAPSQTTPPSVVAAAPLSAADLIATLRSNLVGDHRQAISAVQNDAKNQQLHAMLRQIIAHHMARDDEEALAYLLAD